MAGFRSLTATKISNEITTESFIKEFSIDEKYIKFLDERKLSILKSDLLNPKFKVFSEKIQKNPELISSYNLVSDNLAIRIEIRYLESISEQLKLNPNKKPKVELLNNINKIYAGKKLNGVPFINKTIIKDGYDIVGVFPDFSDYRLFSHKLNKEYYLSKDADQFNIAKEAFTKEYKKNPEIVKSLLRKLNIEQEYMFDKQSLKGDAMLEKQILDITNPKINKVFGFIWHHNENDGVMELVVQSKHKGAKHIGGKQTWGGGVHNR